MSESIESRGYSIPKVLVSTEWVSQHLNDKNIRLAESNEDQLLYASGHLPGAVEIDWVRDLNQPVLRDYLNRSEFEELCSRSGISQETTVIFYGDRNNWWATYAFWIFKLYGHKDVRIMDGGRQKWEKESRPLTRDVPAVAATSYRAPERDDKTLRAFRDDVLQHVQAKGALVDVRSPDEFSGKRLHMDGYPNEGALRGGHIPGAKNVPWGQAVEQETGEFKGATALRELYEKQNSLRCSDEIISYCRIGERSSHTWFVLTYLLGYAHVRNYDGSWTEWGNLVNVPIEK